MTTWCGTVPANDDFGKPITDEFVDGKVRGDGRWGLMNPESFKLHGFFAKLGPGIGQRYKKQPDGTFLKVEG